MVTKQEWTNNAALALMTKAPNYDYDSAVVEIETYLANTAGGWNPDDGGDPLGDGEPTNADSPDDAATAIYNTQVSDTKTITSTVDCSIKLTHTGSFPTGTSTATILAALKDAMEARIAAEFSLYGGVDFIDADWDNASSSTRFTGALSQAVRQEVENSITTDTVLIDPAAIATNYVRNTYSLDNTWVAKIVYNRSTDYPIIVTVGKYTTSAYGTEDVSYIDGDDTVTYPGYVVQVDKDTHRVQTCSVFPAETRTPT
jgi:hypothetical protein